MYTYVKNEQYLKDLFSFEAVPQDGSHISTNRSYLDNLEAVIYLSGVPYVDLKSPGRLQSSQ